MRVVNCRQNSEEWDRKRRGKPTASRFKEIVTPAKLQLSASRFDYAFELACQVRDVSPCPPFLGNDATEMGQEFESIAADEYSEVTKRHLEKVGFVYPDDHYLWGCSPDRFVMENGEPVGLLEVKTMYPKNLLKSIRFPEKFEQEHWIQCQAQLWITGLKWCDLYGCSPEINNRVTRQIFPCEKTFKAFESALPEFCEEVLKIAETIKPNLEFIPPNFQFKGAEEIEL